MLYCSRYVSDFDVDIIAEAVYFVLCRMIVTPWHSLKTPLTSSAQLP